MLARSASERCGRRVSYQGVLKYLRVKWIWYPSGNPPASVPSTSIEAIPSRQEVISARLWSRFSRFCSTPQFTHGAMSELSAPAPSPATPPMTAAQTSEDTSYPSRQTPVQLARPLLHELGSFDHTGVVGLQPGFRGSFHQVDAYSLKIRLISFRLSDSCFSI
ncbi:Uncharacterised protein [Mycobacteroides abscessus subsp. abscessus]|nr:Uncharacterised protein [Mycobacteroides abscessus subsp. abscessus]